MKATGTNQLKQIGLPALISALALLFSATLYASYETRQDVKDFISMMQEKHGYDAEQLTRWFARAEKQDASLKAIARPAEALPWYKYRKIFIRDSRIEQGIQFWKDNEATLKRAEATYGVPAEIIVGIIGVETSYGQYKGKFPVFDTLITLGFDYPRRGKFFRKELEEYLLLIREEGLDAFEMKGSYAGAVGKPQFISSSYRAYAVDFDGDGKRDLLNNTADAIGSVANYFRRHGWKQGETVIIRAEYKSSNKFPDLGMKPKKSIGELTRFDLFPLQPVKNSELAQPIRLELDNGHEHYLGLHNFYVITRYNHSNLYALAVYQLSQLIKQGKNSS